MNGLAHTVTKQSRYPFQISDSSLRALRLAVRVAFDAVPDFIDS
jgi:hypothetical protein